MRGLQGQRWWKSYQQSSALLRLEGRKWISQAKILKKHQFNAIPYGISKRMLHIGTLHLWYYIQSTASALKVSVNKKTDINVCKSCLHFFVLIVFWHITEWACVNVHACDRVSTNSLGCKVGTCCPNLSSLSMCSSVVLPALSRPRNTNLPDFLYSPERKPKVFQNTNLYATTLSFFFLSCWITLYIFLTFKANQWH